MEVRADDWGVDYAMAGTQARLSEGYSARNPSRIGPASWEAAKRNDETSTASVLDLNA